MAPETQPRVPPVVLTGTPASPGRASGRVVRVADGVGEPPLRPSPADRSAEAARIAPAATAVVARLRAMAAVARTDTAREVLEATVQMAEDPALRSNAERLVTEQGLPAPRAVYDAANTFCAALALIGGYLGERVRDVQDIRDRIIAELTGIDAPGIPYLSEPAVLVARNLAPSDTAGLTANTVLALVTEQGGPTSHTAILARSLGIPAVVGTTGAADLNDGTPVLVDGTTGLVTVLAAVASLDRVTPRAAVWDGVGRTRDGHRVSLLANVADGADAVRSAEMQAEGVGLLRTELAFLSAVVEPTVARQQRVYATVLAAFAGKPVTARTLDAGADKPLPFLPQETEPNPALGLRGLRVALLDTGVLDRQLDALVAAAADSQAELRVMAPMVATAAEARFFARRARSRGVRTVGVMIEVPAAVFTAAEIAAEVDFLSVGTNDLAQYLFAADRQAGSLAALHDPWQPALLRLIDLLCRSVGTTPVGVCGEAAADPELAVVLTGLGVSSLSMGSTALAGVGARLATVELSAARAAAAVALAATSPAHARDAVRAALA